MRPRELTSVVKRMNEYSLKLLGSSNKLESHEMITYSQDASEQPCVSPRFMDDGGNIMEELTVRNYDSSNLAIVGNSADTLSYAWIVKPLQHRMENH
ncbi:uncharacterized protein LOC126673295 isoform X2 [Mercurialis annua]|nr:uncharacterized protein LOC126673295 isoform X2 [Mercurialis annua]